MSLREFESALRELIGKPTDFRPFVCDGSPLSCSAFIVGYNPATEMTADWWDFWDPSYGYRRDVWFEEYQRERAMRPLKPGKTRRPAVSNTRRVIDWVVDSAAPIRCLETNIYAAATDTAAALAEKQRVTAPFDFLLHTIRPRVILVHGDEAIDHLGKLSETNLTWGRDASVSLGGYEVWIVAEAHFGRPRGGQGWSAERARQLGGKLKQLGCDQDTD